MTPLLAASSVWLATSPARHATTSQRLSQLAQKGLASMIQVEPRHTAKEELTDGYTHKQRSDFWRKLHRDLRRRANSSVARDFACFCRAISLFKLFSTPCKVFYLALYDTCIRDTFMKSVSGRFPLVHYIGMHWPPKTVMRMRKNTRGICCRSSSSLHLRLYPAVKSKSTTVPADKQ